MKVKVQISLDGASESTYKKIRGNGYSKVITSIQLLLNYGCEVAISIVPMKENLDEISDIIDLVSGMGIKDIHLALLERSGRAEEFYDNNKPTDDDLFILFTNLYEQYIKPPNRHSVHLGSIESMVTRLKNPPLRFSCKAGREVIAIDRAGNLYPCSGFVGSDYAIGSLLESKLHDLYHDEKLNFFRTEIDVRNIDKCKDCPFILPCVGGCRVRAHLIDNSLTSPDPYCDFFMKMWEFLLWELSDMEIME